MAKLELDKMEYATNGAAQAAYVSDSSANLQSYSEATIKTQGDYSLKVVADTASQGKTLTHTLSPASDLTGVNDLKIDMRSDRTGANVKLSLLGAGGAASVTGGEVIDNGSCLDFGTANSSKYVSLASSIGWGTDGTLSIWVKDVPLVSPAFNSLMGQAVTVGYVILFYNGQIYVGSASGTEQVFWTNPVTDYTKKTLYTLVKTDTNVEMFVNGVGLGGQYLSQVASIDYIGYAQTAPIENGKLDEICIFNRALSAVEVAQIYNAGKGLWADPAVAPYNSGLVNAWHCDENTGTTIADSVSGNTGTFVDSPAWGTNMVLENPRTSKYSNALDFNGTTNSIDLGSPSSTDFGNDENFTLSVWVDWQGSAQGYTSILSREDIAGTGYAFLIKSDNKLAMYLSGNYSPFNMDGLGGDVSSGVHLLTVTCTGSDGIRTYIDGILDYYQAGTYYFGKATGKSALLGDSVSAGRLFDGVIGEVYIFNRALSASEIAVLYNGAKGIYGDIALSVFSGLVAGYHLNETTGTSIADFSGNSNTGTLTGTLTSVTGAVQIEVPLTEVNGAYTTHTFLQSGTITTTSEIDCEVLLVAGGGGGASGGGGAGGVLYSASLTLPAGTYNVVVGTGGDGGDGYTGSIVPTNGVDSTLSTLTAIGGGAGGYNFDNSGPLVGADGGSGGGAPYYSVSQKFGGNGTSGQGFDGGSSSASYYGTSPFPSGSGGGVTEVGNEPASAAVGGIGGAGQTYDLLGGLFVVGKGGDGTTYGDALSGKSGKAYTGNGSDGSGNNGHSGNGGSGMIVIRYLTPTVTTLVEYTHNIVVANQFQTVRLPISDIADISKSVISGIKITIENDDSANTFYLDNFEIAQAIDVVGLIN